MKRLLNWLMPLAILLSSQLAMAEQQHDLQKAFFKEYTFLLKEKKALEARLKQVKQEQAREKANLKKTIAGLKESAYQSELEAQRINDQINTVEKETLAKESNRTVFEATLDQANATLYPDNEAKEDTIKGVVSQSLQILNDNAQVRTQESRFFLKDGSEVAGQVVHFGGIARYGISPTESGPLAPAGGGAFKLWQASSQQGDLIALSKGQIPENLEIFLFESPTKAVKEVQEKDVLTIINSGGIVAWIIVGLGGVALLFALIKALFLIGLGRKSHKQFDQIAQAVAASDLEAARAMAGRTKGSIKRVINSALNNITREREHVEDAISEAILHENIHLDRFQSIIMVIAAIAPLLGLLGTVTGMIETFDIITEYGTGDPKLLSGGISIALVTTELGLIVAIPVLVLGTLLGAWSNRIKDDLEKSALHLVNQYQNAQNK